MRNQQEKAQYSVTSVLCRCISSVYHWQKNSFMIIHTVRSTFWSVNFWTIFGVFLMSISLQWTCIFAFIMTNKDKLLCLSYSCLWRSLQLVMRDEIFKFESSINSVNFLKYFKTSFLKFSLKCRILVIIHR